MELKIKKETAKEIYDESPSGLRKILEETFGIDLFKKTDFKDFKTFDDLCRACGTTEVEFNSKWEHANLDPSSIAFDRLKICTRAYNQDWPFDAYNTEQIKYYPYFEVSSSGFGFSCTGYYYDGTDTAVGSRLCFESEEKARHAGKTFIKLFEDFITAKY
jgi:hypothetical protein